MAEANYIGLELNDREVRLCTYNRITKEADTVMIRAGGSRAESPAHMAFVKETGQWKYGIEADYFAAQKGCTLFDGILEHCVSGQDFEDNGKAYPCKDVVGELIKQALIYAGIKDPAGQVRVFVMTVPSVNRTLASVMESAFEYAGLKDGQAYLQSFDESFFAHTFFQKQEIYSRDVGLFCFNCDEVKYSRLHLDQRTKPAIVTVGDNAYDILPAEEKSRDACFEAFIKENTSDHEFSSFFLVGNGFNRKWAKESLKLLCKSQRKVFYGNNLFAKGACYSAFEKANPHQLKNRLYLGKDLVRKNIGMELMTDGISMYHPLITAGINWFDAENSCDILLNGDNTLVFRTSRLEDGKRANYSMALEGLPERPPKTTRLHIELRFENAEKCVVTVKDLGFGELFPSSGKTWTDQL
ncbi:MAG TPA: hypothetical protein IAB17_00045 [Candidatus Alectryocaccobium stercorigallinarum]|nr:hypothetical protein [Candidatus Alectryocaccobium stercorigallinarum]